LIHGFSISDAASAGVTLSQSTAKKNPENTNVMWVISYIKIEQKLSKIFVGDVWIHDSMTMA